MLEVAAYIMNQMYHEFDLELEESLETNNGFILQELDENNTKENIFIHTLRKSGVARDEIQCVKAEHQLEIYEDYNIYIYVLRIKDRYFQFNGTYCSYNGLDISLDDPKEVFPFQRTITDFSTKQQ